MARVVRHRKSTCTSKLSNVLGVQKKGPLNVQRPLVNLIFRSYDNPHTICQNLPEAAATPAEAEEG
ncbi:MAG TPA: hypothetical protein VMR90_09370 [Candidatus Cybelea sp.]|nr:hypothetical protein [Candidatus Cybelea sp.]